MHENFLSTRDQSQSFTFDHGFSYEANANVSLKNEPILSKFAIGSSVGLCGKEKICSNGLSHMPYIAPTLKITKTYENLLLRNQLIDDLETRFVAIFCYF